MIFDPVDATKQMMATFEKNLGEFLQKTMREPAFMQLVAKNLETSLDVRGAMKAQLERAMKSFNIPTEDSMASLYQTVHNLETRLLDLEEKVDELTTKLEAVSRPAAQPCAKAAPPPRAKPAAAARPKSGRSKR